MTRVSRLCHQFVLVLLVICSAASSLAGPPVVLTEPLTPAEQQEKFKLPAGFEIQLVAAEPDIQKPMNIAFDAYGRLWVTHSVEYPFAAENADQARDGLTILDGIGDDGRATRVTRFADHLNIPIGILPLPNGREAIVWSIPNIWKLSDTDGDGIADKREVLYGPFDFVDTHGDQNAFRLGQDGWVYACHGFRNSSKVKLKGEGPVVLEMQSGNTYRFRTDGSAIEQMTWGQVNPFGQCVDFRGDRFTADCHSKPITLMLRGAYYESFGKPHGGLGFAPLMTSNDHGSTGIAGVVVYSSNHFPPEYAGNFFVGNVVTNVIHRDQPQWRGSTPWIEKPEDFVTCDDQWFHPVDLQLGPDGALYVCDFYNSIIGHYEVDLRHPRRDRHRGRIWRIVYRGDGNRPSPAMPNLAVDSQEDLIHRLSHPNQVVREFASQQLEQRFREKASESLRASLLESGEADKAKNRESQAAARVQTLWYLFRQGRLDDSVVERLSTDHGANSPDSAADLVRIHLARVLGEFAEWNETHKKVIRLLAEDTNPFVRRAAIESIGRHPDPQFLKLLLHVWKSTDAADVQLIYATRIATRNQLRTKEAFDQIPELNLTPEELSGVAEIALAIPTEFAAGFTLSYLKQNDLSEANFSASITHIARYSDVELSDALADEIQKKYPDDVVRQASLLQSVMTGLSQRGAKLSLETRLGRWAASLATSLLIEKKDRLASWENVPLSGAATANPWGVRHRESADGNREALYFDSIVNGEKLTGILRSGAFTIPEELSFWLCGHNGFPDTNPPPVNHVRLRLVDSGEIVAQEIPPRNDVARQCRWNLKPWSGKQGQIEVVDADSGAAYAWIAVGRFEPAVVIEPNAGFSFSDAALATAIQVAGQLRLKSLADAIITLLKNRGIETTARTAAAKVGLELSRETAIRELVEIVGIADEPIPLKVQAAQLLGSVNSPVTREGLGKALRTAPAPLQQPIALALVRTNEGATSLFDLIATGRASARLLQDKPILERLAALSMPDGEQKIKALTLGLPAADDRLKQTLARFSASFATSRPAAEAGAPIFAKSCSACHRIGDQGGKIGPQLDGVGIRGIERLLEDVLDPNRNVDAAFRATVIEKKDGLVVTGLKLREEGTTIVLGDSQGKEIRVAADEIEESRLSNLSPMPSNFADQLNEEDLRSLIAYLLAQSQKTKTP